MAYLRGRVVAVIPVVAVITEKEAGTIAQDNRTNRTIGNPSA